MNPTDSYIGALHFIENVARILRETIKNGQQVNSTIEATGQKTPDGWKHEGYKIQIEIQPGSNPCTCNVCTNTEPLRF